MSKPSLRMIVLLSAIPTIIEVSGANDYIVGGDNLTLTCRVGYVGQRIRYIYLIQYVHGVRRQFYNPSQIIDSDNVIFPGMKTWVSEYDIIVPLHAEYLPKCLCFTQFYTRYYYYNPGHSPNRFTQLNVNRV